jgi:hypothetical protein
MVDVYHLSLLKNLSDHRGRSSTTATVGHARKSLRSRNRVTVIVKIEGRDLDGRPGYGLPYAISGKGGISPKRPRESTITGWLRPRDVRTDDGVHRPREMRRSCQLKAVESSEAPDSLYLVTDAFCSGDNNENNKTKRDGGASH